MDLRENRLAMMPLRFRGFLGFRKAYCMLVIYFRKKILILNSLIVLRGFINKNFLNSLNNKGNKLLIAKIVKLR